MFHSLPFPERGFMMGNPRSVQTASILNLSHSGCYLQAGEMLPQRATVQVRFPLPSGKICEASRRVVCPRFWTGSRSFYGLPFRRETRL